MKKAKKLSAIILTIALLVSSVIPVFANNIENTEKGLKLQAIGLMAGGVNDLKLDEDLNRLQGLIFAIRAAGKEAEALSMSDSEVNSILANVVDRNSIPVWTNNNAHRYVAYAVKYQYTLGTDSSILPKVKFGPMDPISGTSFLVFLMKSGMGYADVTTTNVIDKAIEAKILTYSEAVKYGSKQKLIRDDAAGILYGAAMNGINANGKKLIEALIESGFVVKQNAINAGFIKEEVKTISLKAVGARKLQVSFSEAVDSSKITIQVKRGTVTPYVKSVTYAEDKKSAILEFSTDMAEGEYTVTVSGLGSTSLTASTIVTVPKLTVIKFQSDVAIKKGNDITVRVTAENQYGEDMTSRLNNATVVVSPQGLGATIQNGLITVRGASSDYYKENSKVVITVIDSTGSVNASASLTVSASAGIESITFGELTTDDDSLKGKDINVEAMSKNASKYYLPMTVRDQYGNILKAEELSSLTIINSDPSVIQLADTKIVNDNRYGTVLKFKNTVNGKAGNSTITVVGVKSGGSEVVTVSKTITILDNPKIDQVYLSTPSGTIKQNTAIVLPVTVVDIYQRQIELKDISFGTYGTYLTMNGDTVLTAYGGTLRVDKNLSTGETNIVLTPTAAYVVLSVTTATYKTNTLNLTALEAPVATSIAGMQSDFVSMLVGGSSLSTPLKGKVKFLDQYGEEIAAPQYKDAKTNGSTPYYTISKANPSSTITSISSGVISAGSTPGTDVYIVELLDKNSNLLDSIEVTITVVSMESINSFVIGDLDKFYTGTGAGSGKYNQQIKVYGVISGQKVEIGDGSILYVSATNGLGAGINSSTGLYTGTLINTDGKDQTSEITVLLANGQTVKKTVAFSSAAPVAQSLVVKYKGTIVTSSEIQLPRPVIEGRSLVGNGSTTEGLVFEAKDQYGKYAESASFNFIVTNKGTSGNVSTTGFASGFLTSDSGKSLQLYVFVGDLSRTIKIIIE